MQQELARKKVALIGLAAKYGSSVRKKHGRVMRILKMKRDCPSCGSKNLKRIAAGIWGCTTCTFKLADGAYDTTTLK